MSTIRRATPDDASELVRLRKIMQDSLSPAPDPDVSWQPAAVETLRKRLADPTGDLTAFVVDRPDGGLAACVVGTIEYRLGGPGNPHGTSGYVFSVATDEDMRRRGFSRGCMEALLGWFRERGVPKVDLRASSDGEPLYTSLGFVRTPDPAMRLTLR
ncbi:GNAT family N-acetyltransferase [Streptomyces sp. NBC_01387]|uniref:GNAT family N-acetyltransferase n=1 Tax=unclassified Streptomyces TaxID=2593676 RepID=UPI0020257C8D|nr:MULTISPECIES: GNAT family N-acetyltransferase [unclassified Streptomyces]MCX4551321.1 GNAT family N-acetyltransferase [Streptomyces sp. NBC_01500]WSC22706.1 GNAT family N-acetyltransferase [Streptomyces sp. NBC_01766]WSV56631.1 GNAT family N-acetyltransferase [Streptomyces sp. NBC_01014]